MEKSKTLSKKMSAKDVDLEYPGFLEENLSEVDPDIDLIIGFEEERQKEK